VLALATLAGLVVLWPGEVESGIAEGILVDSERGTVERVEETACPGLIGQDCRQVFVRLESGPESGELVQLQLGGEGFDPDVDLGDEVRVTKTPEPAPGAEPLAGTG
jgi:hypothetical protein